MPTPTSFAMEDMLIAHGCGPVAGVDEAGRGACAGPLTIGACILPPGAVDHLPGLTDSKKLSPARREQFFPLIKEHALAWSVVHVSVLDIDRWGIQHANISGMRRAIAHLAVTPGYVLIDGFSVPGLPMPSLPVVKGDMFAASIAAASIVAKVSRDHLMLEADDAYPQYGFCKHKGYGTRTHQEAMETYGICCWHRRSFGNVKKAEERAGFAVLSPPEEE